jgi:hypothetical protein
MTHQRAADQLPPIHKHQWKATNPYQPEADRCECGMYRYEVMGPIARAKVRMRTYDRPMREYPR